MRINLFSGFRFFTSRRSSTDPENISFNRVLFTKVTSQLFIGSFEDAMHEEALRNCGVTHIISVIGPIHVIQGMRHGHIPMNDYGRTELKTVLKELWPLIEESQEPEKALFIHCMNGQNRSATVVLAILMLKQEKTLYKAYKLLKNKRPIVQINESYAKQLLKIELELFGSNSVPINWMETVSNDMKEETLAFVCDSVSQPTSSI